MKQDMKNLYDVLYSLRVSERVKFQTADLLIDDSAVGRMN
jgi:hypothetical protein